MGVEPLTNEELAELRADIGNCAREVHWTHGSVAARLLATIDARDAEIAERRSRRSCRKAWRTTGSSGQTRRRR